MDNRERRLAQKLFYCDEEMAKEQAYWNEILYEYNHTRPSEPEKREQILKQLLAEMGEGCYIEPPLHANWGSNTHLGHHVYANFNLTLVDDIDIYIGSNTMIGPNVVIATAGHPIQPELRRKVAQYNIPVRIGENVWLGAGVIVLPGVTIGDNAVVGAGSIVTRDIPANVVAYGNPCRVIREIGEHDARYYYRDMEIDLE